MEKISLQKTLIPSNKITEILDIFNSYHPRLKFTHEVENEQKIPFLDLSIIRENNKLITNWYHKPTFSSRFINFHSNCPKHQKVALIYNLIDHAYKLSDNRFLEQNLLCVKKILIINDFPLKFIDKYTKKRIYTLRNNTPTNNRLIRNRLYADTKKISVPYNRELFKNMGFFLNSFNINLIPRSARNFSHLVIKGKDKLKKNECTYSVYKIPCNNCSASYVGESKRHLEVRIGEDKESNEEKFVVFSHQKNYNHSFDWDNVSILDREPNFWKRQISEMIHIFTRKLY